MIMKENPGRRCCIPQCQRQCPLQWWHRQEVFPSYGVKVGLLQLQSIPKSSSRPSRGQTQPLESWDTPAGLCLPGPAGENLSLCVLTAPAWTQPLCPCTNLSAKSVISSSSHNLCCFSPAQGHSSPSEAVSLDTGLPTEQRGCSACSGLWAGQPSRDSWNTMSVPLDLAATLCHCPAPPQPGGELNSLGMRMGLGDALLPTRMGLASEHGPAAFAASACPGGRASCHPLPWEHMFIPALLI